MEPLDPGLVAESRKQAVVVGMLGFSLCFLAPAIYLLMLVQIGFHGTPRFLIAGFHSVPWGDPRIIVLSMVSVAFLAAGPFLANQFWARAERAGTSDALFANLRTGHIIHCALLESVAIFGLVLGLTVGPSAGPMCLVLMLVPPLGYLLFVPGGRARMRLLSRRASVLPGGRLNPPPSIQPGDDLDAP